MKILIILTGGTIGSSFCDNYISLEEKSPLLKDYPHFDTISPYTILSEQLTGNHLNLLINCIKENLAKDYQGIIVTHGTDTLQYTASALSCAFGDSEIPIVLVSSNYILTNPKANGKDNFENALRFIEEKIGGVFVSYKNTNSKGEIHQGNMLLPHSIYNDDVNSIEKPFGYMENNKFIQQNSYKKLFIENEPHFTESSKVLWLKIHPSMPLPDTNNYKAIMLESYHSGTLPTQDENFIKFCKNCQAPIFLVGTKIGAQYESTKAYKDLEIMPLPHISPFYAYIRLWLGNDMIQTYKELCNEAFNN